MSIHTEYQAPLYLIIGMTVPVEDANILYFGDKSKYLLKISILILTFAQSVLAPTVNKQTSRFLQQTSRQADKQISSADK